MNSTTGLDELLDDCTKGNRVAQKKLYQSFYSYAMSVCLRYANNKPEAQEILNDSFLKVFANLKTFDRNKPFRWWLRRILINTAIDYFRRSAKQIYSLDAEGAAEVAENQDILSAISAEEILALVQALPPAYRMVFNLYAIEGYTHAEIAEKLGIHEGTSKSNYAKARANLQKKILKELGSEKWKVRSE